jgi:predicted aspartyl protease
VFDVYEAVVIWDGQRVTIPIDEAQSDPLIGMSLMEGYELTIQAIENGDVKLTKLPAV